MRIHLDADFLIYAVGRGGPERERLRELARSDAILQMSAVAWYEFARGPRTPEQLAMARGQLEENDGVVELSEALAVRAADVFRALGSPRKRAADVAIGVTAASLGATLVTRNRRDFAGIPDLVVEVVTS